MPAGHDSSHRPKTFDEIKGSILDGDGAFIYLIIDITNEESGRTKTIVRGYKDLMHLQILEKFQLEECDDIPWDDEVEHWHVACRAGGRIRHVDDDEEKKMYLYGYFISASHEEAVSIIEKDYKNYEFQIITKDEFLNLDYRTNRLDELILKPEHDLPGAAPGVHSTEPRKPIWRRGDVINIDV